MKLGHSPVLLALGVLAALGCTTPGSSPPELAPLPALPDLAAVDPAVRKQLRERHDLVVRLLANGATRPGGLAWAYGQLGKVYHAYLDLDRARVCYRNARTLEDDEVRWPYYLGHVERTEGRFALSSTYFAQARALRPADAAVRYWLGENEIDLGRPERARAFLNEALARDPGSVKALEGLARIALAAGRYAEALSYLEPALAAQPQATPVHYSLGTAHRGLGDLERARAFFDRVPPDNQTRVPIRLHDPLMQEISDLRDSTQYRARLGMRALARGEFDWAIREFEKAVAKDGDRADTRYNLAAALLKLGRKAEARHHLDELIRRTPDYSLGRVLLARIHLAENNVEQAELELRRALESDPGSEKVHLALSDTLRRAGRLDEARESYRRAVELAPEIAATRTESGSGEIGTAESEEEKER